MIRHARRRRRRRTAATAVGVALLASSLFSVADAAEVGPVRGAASASVSAERVDPPAPPPAPAPPDSPAQDVVDITNGHRAANGRPSLVVDPALALAAKRHSDDQAARNRMGHDGSDGSGVGDRIDAAGGSWSTAGENVAFGYPTAERVMVGWMNSSGHRANILRASFTRIGVAVSYSASGRAYWTMVLAG